MELAGISLLAIAFVLALVAVGAWIKGLTGMGLPVFAVPAIATFTTVEEAVIIMIIPGLGSNLWLIASHRRHKASLGEHRVFLIGGFLGGAAGTLLLEQLDDRWLKSLLALWLGFYLLQRLIHRGSRLSFRPGRSVAAAIGGLAGAAQGAVGISAQIVAPYFNRRDIEPSNFAFLMSTAFLVFSVAQLITAVSEGLFTPDRVAIGAAALIPVAVFTQLGIRYANRVSQDLFQKILIGVFVLMELKLVWDVLSTAR